MTRPRTYPVAIVRRIDVGALAVLSDEEADASADMDEEAELYAKAREDVGLDLRLFAQESARRAAVCGVFPA